MSHQPALPTYKVVTIGSSSKFYGKAKEIHRILELHGVSCHTPHFDFDETKVTVGGDRKTELTLSFLQKIDRSSILYVVAENGYVGASTTLEIGYACGRSKDIFSTEPINEVAVRTLVNAAVPVEELIEYIKSGRLGVDSTPPIVRPLEQDRSAAHHSI